MIIFIVKGLVTDFGCNYRERTFACAGLGFRNVKLRNRACGSCDIRKMQGCKVILCCFAVASMQQSDPSNVTEQLVSSAIIL